MEYYVFNPSGNVTALVTVPVPVLKQAQTAREILSSERSAEQVGFVSEIGENSLALRMSGGEFCGNACMCAAALCAIKNGADKIKASVRISALETPCVTTCEKTGDNSFYCSVEMPTAKFVGDREFSFKKKQYTLPYVEFDGISHIIVNDEISLKQAETAVKKWCRELSLKSLGIMFYDKKTDSLTPLVYVDESETLYWEGSCASGSAAVAEYACLSGNSDICLTLKEPRGKLTVKKCREGKVTLFSDVIMEKAPQTP